MKSMLLRNKVILPLACVGLLAVLTSCSGKNAPDEYMVLKNQPLAVPPEFHMTPGGPTEDLDDVIAPQELAKRALFGES